MINKADGEEKHQISDLEKVQQKLQNTAKEIELFMTKSKKVLEKLSSEQMKFNQEKPALTNLAIPEAPTVCHVSFKPGRVNRAQLAEQIGDLLSSKDILICVSILNKNKFDSGIISVNTVDGNYAWVKVYDSYNELRLVDTDGKVVKCIKTNFEITDFAVGASGGIITTDYNGRYIRIMTETGEVTKTINTNPNRPTGIYLGENDQMMVVCVTKPDRSCSKLVVYSRSGKKIRTINYTEKPVGQNFVQRVTQNTRGDYCVAHYGHKKVYVVDSNGALRYTYDGSGAGELMDDFSSYDICSDIFNHLFISDSNNHAVHMLDDEGKFLRFILTEQDGITKPTGLCIDKNRRLWVGQDNGDLCIVKYLEKTWSV